MPATDLEGLRKSFKDLPDPCHERNEGHPVESIVAIALWGTIWGADNWVDSEAYGTANREWLSNWLDWPTGIPSHATVGGVFGFRKPPAFPERFRQWIGAVGPVSAGAKAIPHGKEGLSRVRAWAAAQGIVLGQRKVDAKSNEITAIPDFVEVLAVEGCAVTLAAMGGPTASAATMIDQPAAYR